MKVTLLLPTLNEILGLKTYLPRIDKRAYEQVLVLDGGSTDGSVAYAREMGFEVLEQTRRGMRFGYIDAHPHMRGDVVIVFSPDGNSLLEAIPPLIEMMGQGYDMVIASRYKDGARSYDDTALTGAANFCFSKLISCFGYRYTDAMVMYRAWRRDLPERLGLLRERSPLYEKLLGRYVSWEPLLSIRAAKARLKIGEVPADEPRRLEDKGGNLFLPPTRIHHFRAGFASLAQVVEEAVRWKWD